jgi:CitMHS family citrate-Mg2+:H+ or citrate-Ca2+:H+ symporter
MSVVATAAAGCRLDCHTHTTRTCAHTHPQHSRTHTPTRTHAHAHTLTAPSPPPHPPCDTVISAPFCFLISNDAFYFGVLPALAETASRYNVTPEQIGRASLVGQQVHLLSPLVASTYLLVGFVGIEFGEHQRFTLRWALGSCAVFGAAALATGAFPFVAAAAAPAV